MTQPRFTPLGLGRVEAPADPRDNNFPMSLVLAEAPPAPPSRYWYPGLASLNQGALGACVGFTGANWLQNSPVRTKVQDQTGLDLYWACKAIDGIPNIEGTYARVLLKILQERGHVGRYLWAQRPEDIKQWVLTTGPVMVGTPWFEEMFFPDLEGYVSPRGFEMGGHEYLVRGYSRPRDAYRCRNSWGNSWGIGRGSNWSGMGGEFWIKREDLEAIIFSSWGDAVGVEQLT